MLGLLPGLALVLCLLLWLFAWVFYEEAYRPGLATHQCVGIAYRVAQNLGGREPKTDAELAEAVARIPESGNMFVRDSEGRLVDAWGTPFHVRVVHDDGRCKVVVRSAGPDRVLGNEDDFVYDSLLLQPRRERDS